MARKFHPFLYWATIAASTTFGRRWQTSLNVARHRLYRRSLLLFTCLMVVLALWYWSEGTISVNTVSTPRWRRSTGRRSLSQTLGTALDDWIADTGGLGYEGGALVFGAGLAVAAALYFSIHVSRVSLFWTAFILTRPLERLWAISSTSR